MFETCHCARAHSDLFGSVILSAAKDLGIRFG
jgi:hypothetical protein